MEKVRLLLPFLSAFLLLALVSGCACVQKTPINQELSPYSAQFSKVSHQAKSDSIIGYKAGLTSQAGQTKFKVSEPIAGVLFKSGLAQDRSVYLLRDHQKLMLETEIGFIFKHDLEYTINNPHHLAKLIDKVVPVIELPDLAYPNLASLTGEELIATNVASNKVLIGKGMPLNFATLNKVATQLKRNGEIVIQGKASDAMGDQMLALLWLVNRTIKSGYKIKAGDLLITGALGKMIPAEKGQYDADFGVLGSLAFSVRD